MSSDGRLPASAHVLEACRDRTDAPSIVGHDARLGGNVGHAIDADPEDPTPVRRGASRALREGTLSRERAPNLRRHPAVELIDPPAPEHHLDSAVLAMVHARGVGSPRTLRGRENGVGTVAGPRAVAMAPTQTSVDAGANALDGRGDRDGGHRALGSGRSPTPWRVATVSWAPMSSLLHPPLGCDDPEWCRLLLIDVLQWR